MKYYVASSESQHANILLEKALLLSVFVGYRNVWLGKTARSNPSFAAKA